MASIVKRNNRYCVVYTYKHTEGMTIFFKIPLKERPSPFRLIILSTRFNPVQTDLSYKPCLLRHRANGHSDLQ